jgi:hypothetical protein
MQITLIRHGSTAGNALKQYIGTTDESLSEEGRLQAAAAGGDKAQNDNAENIHVFSDAHNGTGHRKGNGAQVFHPSQDGVKMRHVFPSKSNIPRNITMDGQSRQSLRCFFLWKR